MAQEPEVDAARMFREALLRLREEKVLESIQVLEASLNEPEGENRREQLLQARLDLTRKLRSLREQGAAESSRN